MNERRDENWLDDQLRRVVNTSRPEFDVEAWKQNHPEAYDALISRGSARRQANRGTRRTVRLMAGGLAAAAVILMGVALLVTWGPSHEPPEPPIAVSPKASSQANIVSMGSLRTAYRQGGQEALNQQLDTALKKLGPRPGTLSASQVLSELEG